MNKNLIFFTLMFTIFTTHASMNEALTEQDKQPSKGVISLTSSYGLSLISGSVIGGITGTLCKCAMDMLGDCVPKNQDNNTLISLLVVGAAITIWIQENKIRSTLIHELDDACKENEIKFRKKLSTEVAYIASWIGFLLHNSGVKIT